MCYVLYVVSNVLPNWAAQDAALLLSLHAQYCLILHYFGV